jgi:DNA-nicking Smr family endonuclease
MNKPPYEDDAELFREAVRDVRRLRNERPALALPKPRPRAAFTRADQHEVLRESLLPVEDPAALETGDELSFRRAQISEKVLLQLRRGRYAVQAELDLHGMTAVEARAALRDFIAECLSRGMTCVRIIHGKGRGSGPRGPVLKNLVNGSLRKFAAVLAFGSARAHDGGSGAVYVLLARRA